MRLPPLYLTLALFLTLVLSVPGMAQEKLHILVMGDSMLAVHNLTNRAVSGTLRKELGADVSDHSVLGARIIYNLPISGALGFKIAKQYRKGDWDWVVVNGGGNDLLLGCGCMRCNRKMNKLISDGGGKGKIPKLIRKLRKSGVKVAYVGYLRSPGVGSPIEQCRDEGDELERRISNYVAGDEGAYFVSLADLVPMGDSSFHAFDMIHPSIKGSREIGLRIVNVIRQVEKPAPAE